MGKSDQLHMRIAPDLKAEIVAEADRRHIDVSALVSLVLTSWLSRNREKPDDLAEIDVPPRDRTRP